MANKTRTVEFGINAKLDTSDLDKKIVNIQNKIRDVNSTLAKSTNINVDVALKNSKSLEDFKKNFENDIAKIKATAQSNADAIKSSYDTVIKTLDAKRLESIRALNNSITIDPKDTTKTISAKVKAEKEALKLAYDEYQKKILEDKNTALSTATGKEKKQISSDYNINKQQAKTIYEQEVLSLQKVLADKSSLVKQIKQIDSQFIAEKTLAGNTYTKDIQTNKKSTSSQLSEFNSAIRDRYSLNESGSTLVNTRATQIQKQQEAAIEAQNARVRKAYEERKKLAAEEQANQAKESKAGALVQTGASIATLVSTLGNAKNIVLAVAEFNKLEARVKAVSVTSAEASDNMKALMDISAESGQTISSTAGLFSKLSTGIKAAGFSTKEALSVTRVFQDSLRASGTSADQAAASAYQFSQAIGSGVLRGDELNSVIEGNIQFANALAKGLGVSVGELKNLGQAGALTSTQIVGALVKQEEAMKKSAEAIPLGPMEQWNVTVNQLTKSFADLDKEYKIVDKISHAIKLVGDNAKTIVPIITLLGGSLAALSLVNLTKGLGALAGLTKGNSLLNTLGLTKAVSSIGSSAPVTAIRQEVKGLGSDLLSKVLPVISSPLVIGAGVASAVALLGLKGYIYSQESQRERNLSTNKVGSEQAITKYQDSLSNSNLGFNDQEKVRQNALDELNKYKRDLQIIQSRGQNNKGGLDASDAEAARLQLLNLEKTQSDLENRKGTQESTIGKNLKSRAALGLTDLKSTGAGLISKDEFETLKALPNALDNISNSSSKLGDQSFSIADLSAAIDNFAEKLKSPQAIIAGINQLRENVSKSLPKVINDQMLKAASDLSVKLEESINSSLDSSISSIKKRASDYESALKIYRDLIKGTLSLEQETTAAKSDIENARKGIPTSAYDAQTLNKSLELERNYNKSILKDRLTSIEIEKNAKVKQVELDRQKSLASLDEQDKKRDASIQKTIEQTEKISGSVASDRKISLISENYDKNQNNVSGAQIMEGRIASEKITQEQIKQIEISTLQQRVQALQSYMSTVEDAYRKNLQSYKQYTLDLINLDKEQIRARKGYMDELKGLDVKDAQAKDKKENDLYKDKRYTGFMINPENIAKNEIDIYQTELDRIEKELKNTQDLTKKAELLQQYREQYTNILRASSEAISSVNLDEFDRDKANKDIREKQRDFIKQEQKYNDDIINAKRDDLTKAQDIAATNADAASNERAGLNADLTKTQGLLTTNAKNSLKASIGVDPDQLRNSIEEVLRTPFKVKVEAEGIAGSTATSGTPVVINMDGQSIKGTFDASANDIQSLFQKTSQAAGGRG